MEIKSIDIRAYYSASVRHIAPFSYMKESKTVPMLSVVQPLAGEYIIGIDDDPPQHTGERGVFAAPRNRLQHIEHCLDENGHFEAHWLFLDVVINGLYSFEELFDIPLILPEIFNDAICELLGGIRHNRLPFGNYARIHSLLEILTLCSTPKEPSIGELAVSIRDYISRHYPEHLTPESLAERFNLSVPSLYRFFSNAFGMSPSNYINEYRLQRAALLLEHGNDPIKEVSAAVGFTDEFYFSKLFKKRYSASPKSFRDSLLPVHPAEKSGATIADTSASIFRNCKNGEDEDGTPFAGNAYSSGDTPPDFVRCIDMQEPNGIIRPD